ncbi:actinodin2 [Myxocyprinus asiaticus]|uniref:actinodin2 n=1 Tax=Myxocyprinus asiaticus TaxID=70543 RepID=UPI002221A35D|nr:actinodin2 [Myxocyprinus asiaticus]
MARLTLIICGIALATVFMPDFLSAGPVGNHGEEDITEAAPEEKSDSTSAMKKLVRNRRNIANYRHLPDFWGWYKYYMETNNQEGVEDMDRIYLTYLQNKHRVEEGRSYNHYLTHLSEIYKACANSDDPDCIAESTSKPKAKLVMPLPVKQATVTVCNPYLDPYCIYAVRPKAAEEEPSPVPGPAPAKVPFPVLTPLLPLPLRTPPGPHYYYAPVLEPFLSAEQRAELLRICNPSDTECLQYHLRAAYGYKPSLGALPSYAHLGCDPTKDPYCRPKLVARAPSGLYHLYPTCNPAIDPLCVTNVAPAAQTAESAEAPKEKYCNPLFDKGCNPLTASKLSEITKPVLEYTPKDEPAPLNLACDPRYDPYCLIGGDAALRKPPPLLPEFQTRHRLGVRGKTKEGYDCYVFYDKDCTPVENKDLKASAANYKPGCHPYDPSCGKFAAQPSTAAEAAKTMKNGIIEPHPDCDPEIDYNCRLRKAEPAAEEHKDEPAQQEQYHGNPIPEHVAPEYPVPQFEDFLRGYMGGYKK